MSGDASGMLKSGYGVEGLLPPSLPRRSATPCPSALHDMAVVGCVYDSVCDCACLRGCVNARANSRILLAEDCARAYPPAAAATAIALPSVGRSV